MKNLSNALDIFKILPKTNCKTCGLPSCMAFAGHVHLQHKKLTDCPYLTEEALQYIGQIPHPSPATASSFAEQVTKFKKQVSRMNLPECTEQLGGAWRDQKMTLSIFGKPLRIDQNGNIYTDLHMNPWLILPVYAYVLSAANPPPLPQIQTPGNCWIRLRDLPQGRLHEPLFIKRCEEPLLQMAEKIPSLFRDILKLFTNQQKEYLNADMASVLLPLPRLPVLLCYWRTDKITDSALHLFFKPGASNFLDAASLHSLLSGFATMLGKLILRHGKM